MKTWFAEKYGEAWVKDFEQAIADVEADIAKERKRIGG